MGLFQTQRELPCSTDGLDRENERRRDIKDESKLFGLKIWSRSLSYY